MEIRYIKPEEKITASKIQTMSFFGRRDFSNAEKDPEKYREGFETTVAAFDDNGKMCSCMEVIPFKMRFDGHDVNMAGIGGVASLVEERKKRYIREIFKYAFGQMKKRNEIFSVLYPFSHPFYRKFGYEHGFNDYNTKIPVSSLESFKESGYFKQSMPKSPENEIIDKIYREFIEDKNLSVIQKRSFIDKDPYDTLIYTFLHFDDNDKADGYVSYYIRKDNNSRPDIEIKELVWLNNESLHSIFGFLKRYSANCNNIIWRTPYYINLKLLLPEPYNVYTGIEATGMIRIVDVESVLKLMKYPCDNGNAIIEVEDNFISENNGIYKMSWKDGISQVVKTSESPDIKLSVQILAQLAIGFTTIDDYLTGDMHIYKNYDTLLRLFPRKKIYIIDRF